MTNPFERYQVLSFDCYGTLIDWETGLYTALLPLLDAHATMWTGMHARLATFGHLEAEIEEEHPTLPYEEILARVHAAYAASLGAPEDAAADRAFGASIPRWPPFADSREALTRLGSRFKLVILSNVSRAGIAASIEHLGVDFDAVYTAEDIGSYKPADANFAYLLDHVQSEFGVGKDGLLHVAQSLYHDHVPANRHGIANVWIDRQGQSTGGRSGATKAVDVMPRIDHTFDSLADFAAAAVGPA